MESLRFDPADDTPMVVLDQENGHFEISGKSMPEDVVDFYTPVLKWLREYARDANEETTFSFKLIYFNTASSKLFLDIMMILEDIQGKGKEVLIKWHSQENDEDMEEAGLEYEDMMELKFEHLKFDI